MLTLRVDSADIERMASRTLLSYGDDRGSKQSQFWVLLALSGVIATAGVASDSTATVIGAMIVAPLMTPILGTAFSLVLADRSRMARSFLVVLGGVLLVVAIGYGAGLLEPLDTLTDANAQVTGRVSPKLIDLIAALATGLVGAFALVRADIADTLPGVAISISLVPPLAVAGLTLEEGKTDQAWGALLLFATNLTAIIFTATLVLLAYRVRETAADSGYPVGRLSGFTLAAVIGLVALIAVPLGYGTQKVFRENLLRFQAAPVADEWASANGWRVAALSVNGRTLEVTAIGRPPEVAPEKLRTALDDAGFADVDLTVALVIGGALDLPGTRD